MQFLARWIWHTTPLKYLSYLVRWPHKSRSSQGHTWKKNDLDGFANSVIRKILIYDILYVFEVKKSIAVILSELVGLGDLENPGQLPVWEVLWGTDDWVLWIFFRISSLFMFSRSSNPLLTFLLSYHVRVTSKIQVNFRFERYSEVLMIGSYGFPQFLYYLCFRGQEIHCWHSYWAIMFGWPRKSRSASGLRGTPRYWWLGLMDFHNFFNIYVFDVALWKSQQ